MADMFMDTTTFTLPEATMGPPGIGNLFKGAKEEMEDDTFKYRAGGKDNGGDSKANGSEKPPTDGGGAAQTKAVYSATLAQVYRVESGKQHAPLGPAGVAVIRSGETRLLQVLVYDQKKKPHFRAPLGGRDFAPVVQGNYCTVFEPGGTGLGWCMLFRSQDDWRGFVRILLAARAMTEESPFLDVEFAEDRAIAPVVEVGDKVMVGYAAWIGEGTSFKRHTRADKVRIDSVGEDKGQGIPMCVLNAPAGMLRGATRFICIPKSEMGIEAMSDSLLIDPEYLILEINLNKVSKKHRQEGEMATPSKAEATPKKEVPLAKGGSDEPVDAPNPESPARKEEAALLQRMAKLSAAGAGGAARMMIPSPMKGGDSKPIPRSLAFSSDSDTRVSIAQPGIISKETMLSQRVEMDQTGKNFSYVADHHDEASHPSKDIVQDLSKRGGIQSLSVEGNGKSDGVMIPWWAIAAGVPGTLNDDAAFKSTCMDSIKGLYAGQEELLSSVKNIAALLSSSKCNDDDDGGAQVSGSSSRDSDPPLRDSDPISKSLASEKIELELAAAVTECESLRNQVRAAEERAFNTEQKMEGNVAELQSCISKLRDEVELVRSEKKDEHAKIARKAVKQAMSSTFDKISDAINAEKSYTGEEILCEIKTVLRSLFQENS